MILIAALIFALAAAPSGNAFPEKNYALTPQGAVLAVFGGTNVRIIRANVVGRYATVLTGGAIMEGTALNSAVVVEQFSFGWQTIDLLDAWCRLDREGISERDKTLLMSGMLTET